MGVPARRVDEMLELVSLTEAEADRRVGTDFVGMRQRLGIATALIGNPGVLVLDEPANGLDPAGIRWMRDLLRDFANRGGTVLLSSHLLREVEIIADDIVMIGRGKVVCQGSKANLLRGVGSIAAPSTGPALLSATRVGTGRHGVRRRRPRHRRGPCPGRRAGPRGRGGAFTERAAVRPRWTCSSSSLQTPSETTTERTAA